jgi:hypothetical protein
MQKSTVNQLLDQLAAGQNPELSQSILSLLSDHPESADLLKAYEKEPEKNRGLVEDLLSNVDLRSDNPILQIILAALQGQPGPQSTAGQKDDEAKPGSLFGEIIETLADNLLDQPKPKRKTRPKTKPKTTSSSTKKTKAKTGTKTKTKTKTGAKTRPKSSTTTQPKTQSRTKSKPKTTSSTKTKSKSKPTTQTKSAQIDLEEN